MPATATKQQSLNHRIAAQHPRLLRYAKTAFNTPEAAEDAVQEAICRALQHPESYREGTSLDSWMFIILKNVILNSFRDEKPLAPIPTEDFPCSAAVLPPIQTDADALQRALDSLPFIYREALTLRMQGYHNREIARLLRKAPTTIAYRVWKARKLLCKDPYVRELANNCCG